ncbi:MAG: hypothetical protein Q7K65_02670 [Candidatus Buchananbacteria bacterium]|nr:hypothetical protein [Candidatus Buchananbacteria bacterium]
MSSKKEKVVAVVSAMGALLSIVIELVKYIKELGGDVGADIYRLAQKEGQVTLKAIAGLIIQAGQKIGQTAEEASRYLAGKFNLIVDYSLSLAEMIAGGQYDWVNQDITAEHFPGKGTGKQEAAVEILHFNRYFNSGDEVLAEIDKLGYGPAVLPELLALGKDQPELQRQFPIAALGSIWRRSDGSRGFACLGGDGAERLLYLFWIVCGFYGCWRFAVVRKQP